LLTESEDRKFYLAATAVALPFIVVGLSLTVQRLRDAGHSSLLAVLFFLPLGNLFFFFVLCLLPTKRKLPALEPTAVEKPTSRIMALEYGREFDASLFPGFPLLRWWPQDRGASAALAILIPAPYSYR